MRQLPIKNYLPAARRSVTSSSQTRTSRPKGRLIWAHAIDSARYDALVQLAERLVMQGDDVHVLLTTSMKLSPPDRAGNGLIWQPLPEDRRNAAEDFITHWKPDLCLWTGGKLQAHILASAERANIPLLLIDAEQKLLGRQNWRWFPDVSRASLKKFTHIRTRDSKTHNFLRKMDLGGVSIEITGPLLEGAVVLPYVETDRDELSVLLRGRAVWMAAMLQPEEIEAVLTAHREVCRLSHRALLIIVPDDLKQTEAYSAALKQQKWRCINWSDGQFPEETTQVILADTRGEMGLWYRIAPVTFMGSSLRTGQTGRDPNEPAAHGSAILYGPNVRRYRNSYDRYAKSGAARAITDARTLTIGVQRLIMPEQAAKMALAAWDVASQGAGVMDQITDLVQDQFDQMDTR
ncbi:3-deoxy-D-manno-octulosonic acid transferase [Roseovarius sp. EL26]|uniref:3-deoxy-D-manno-octulosonic acid transferase n=1 Tax=Roseovarius sp. EL26 TaxID=2126672 RepID=UPI0020B14739|nr:glycosyltransferase N-terminal domain-containing protein [Roseovarius sp. EL26]